MNNASQSETGNSLEECVQKQEPMQQAIEQFFQTNSVEVDSDFIQRFLHNYQFRDVSVTSEWLYAWYKATGYNTRYDDFCRIVIQKLPRVYFKELQPSQNYRMDQSGRFIDQSGKFIKKQYEVTYIGVRIVMMSFDETVRLYYAKCEHVLQQFFEHQLQTITQQLEHSQQQLQESRQLIDKCERQCTIYRIDIYNDSGDVVQYQYIGSTNNYDTRINQHINNSSNTSVKRYIEAGRRYKIHKEDIFTYHYYQQRAIVEQQYINRIPVDMKLNVSNPVQQRRSRSMSRTDSVQQQTRITRCLSQGGVIEPKPQQVPLPTINIMQQIQSQVLDTVSETNTEQTRDVNNNPIIPGVKSKVVYNAIQSIDELASYLKRKNNVYPQKRSNDKEEHKFATLIECIRKETRDKRQNNLTQFRLEYVRKIIPDFVYDGIEQKFRDSAKRLKHFMEEYQKVPQYNGSLPDEKQIYSFYQRIRQAYEQKDLEYLSEERIQYIQALIPALELTKDTIERFRSRVMLLKDFYDQHQRIPLRRIEEERPLHTLYYAIREQIQASNSEQKRDVIQELLPLLLD